MGVQQPFDVKQRYYLGEFDPSDDDPYDIEYLTSGRAARDARLNQAASTTEKVKEARSQIAQESQASSLSPQDGIVTHDGSAQQDIAQAEGSQDGMLEGELDVGPVAFDGYTYLVPAELAPEGEEFAPFLLIKKYPYLYIGKSNQQKVAERFFDKGQIFKYPWDFFYIHPLNSQDLKAIILVPTSQFTDFLDTINKSLRTHLTIPPGNSGHPYRVFFDHIGTPCPRYLGRAANPSEYDDLRETGVWPVNHKLSHEPAAMKPTDSSIEAFMAKIDLMRGAQQAKNKANKEEAKKNRIKSKKGYGQSIKRVQRYVGLRAVREKEAVEEPNTNASSWDKCVPAPKVKAPIFKANELAPSCRDKDVVFVCIDIEAIEQWNHLITEIGIASIDTRDLAMVEPGENGKNMKWFEHIHARHFRIEEYKHHVNHHCKGCPDKFDFGESEFIREADGIPYLESCLKEPFSKQKPKTVRTPESDMNDLPKRNIILVGHNLQQDINYLEKIGYNICSLSNIIDHVDTQLMFQYLVRAPQPTSLSNVLCNLGIPGWNAHNGGNDAVHTLKAMLGIAIRHLTDKERAEEKKVEFELAEKKRIEEAKAEAEAAVKDQHDGWSSAGEGSDGGDPVKPTLGPAKVKSRPFQPLQSTPTKPQPAMKDTSGSWRAPQAASQVNKPVSGVSLGADKKTENGEPYVYPHLRCLQKKTTAWEDETPSSAPARQDSGVGLGADKKYAGDEQYVLPHLRYPKKKITALEDETPLSAPSEKVSGIGLGAGKENVGGEPYVLPHLRRPKKKTTAWEDKPPLTTLSGQDEDLITFSDQGDEGNNNWGAGPSSVNANTETKTRRTTAWDDEPAAPTGSGTIYKEPNIKQILNHFTSQKEQNKRRATGEEVPSNVMEQKFNHFVTDFQQKISSTSWEEQASGRYINELKAALLIKAEKLKRRRAQENKPQASSQDKFKVDTLLLKRRHEQTNPRTTSWEDETEEQAAINNALTEAICEELENRRESHNMKPRRTTAWDDEPKAAKQTTKAMAGLSLEEKNQRTSEWVSTSGSASTSMSGWGEEFLKVEGKGMNGGGEGVEGVEGGEGEGKDGEVRLGSGIGRKPAPPFKDGW